jgi:hypothetical protein
MLRNKVVDLDNHCQICGEFHLEDALQAAHLLPLSARPDLESICLERKDKDIATGINYPNNGLMVCGPCHGYFDSKQKLITIGSDGKIKVSAKLNGNEKYKKLNGRFVSWRQHINTNGWPSKSQLDLARGYKKRRRKDMLDDLSQESSEQEESPSPVAKKQKMSASSSSERNAPTKSKDKTRR